MSLELDALPDALRSIKTRPLFVMRLDVNEIVVVGPTPGAFRRVGMIAGGRFEGSRLSGDVLAGGNDWQNQHSDGATGLDVRVLLRAENGAVIAMTYRGLRHGPAEVMAALAEGRPVDPASYYFRINPMFETASPELAWLNRLIAIGVGHRLPDGPVYSVFEVL